MERIVMLARVTAQNEMDINFFFTKRSSAYEWFGHLTAINNCKVVSSRITVMDLNKFELYVK